VLNLETAVEREKAVQEIYVHREFLKLVVTLWVIRDFKSFLRDHGRLSQPYKGLAHWF
jgi:hypothetical protein